jgi:hypothetical protein
MTAQPLVQAAVRAFAKEIGIVFAQHARALPILLTQHATAHKPRAMQREL